MKDERGEGDVTPEPEGDAERRTGKDRRKAERRSLEVHVNQDRRSGWDRRRGDRRKS